MNEAIHSVAAKKFNKAIRPSCFEVFQAQIAITAAQKNDGKGSVYFDIVNEFGYVSSEHKEKINVIQKSVIYTWHKIRTDKYKQNRARKRKRYIERQQKRKQNMEKYGDRPMYSTSYKSKSETNPKKRKTSDTNITKNANTNDEKNKNNNQKKRENINVIYVHKILISMQAI